MASSSQLASAIGPTPASPAAFMQQNPARRIPNNSQNPGSRPGTPNSSSPSSLLELPSGMTYAEFIRLWQDAHVSRWLSDNRCGHHSTAFKENDIRGDVILELDMNTLKEIGVTSVGDRTRIRNAIKDLRKRCANTSPLRGSKVLSNGEHKSSDFDETATTGSTRSSRRLDASRPPPLQIDNAPMKDLPTIVRQDSGRLTPRTQARIQRDQAPSLPPAPKGPPPLPPPIITKVPPRQGSLQVPLGSSRSRTPTDPQPPSFTNDPLPPAPSPASPWVTSPNERGLPRNPSPGNLQGGSFAGRVTSPLPVGKARSPNPAATSHQRQGSGGSAKPAARVGAHPYGLAPQPIIAQGLSPVSETFPSGSPPQGYSVGKGPFSQRHTNQQSQDGWRRKILKFYMGESNSRMIEVKDFESGADILEKALRKFNARLYDDSPEIEDCLVVGGWAVALSRDPDANPLSEQELLAVVHDGEHPGRDNLHLFPVHNYQSKDLGRILGDVPPLSPPSGGKFAVPAGNLLNTDRDAYKRQNRASAVIVLGALSGENVSPPSSPGGTSKTSSGASLGKLRNFFGHRPPSELITTHLQEYFPYADKKVLNRTARNSMLRHNTMRHGGSGSSWGGSKGNSRFSTSTMASVSARNSTGVQRALSDASPRASVEEARPSFSLPRLSVETVDGQMSSLAGRYLSKEPALPPVTFEDEEFTEVQSQLRNASRASRRVSKITELKPANPIPETVKSLITVENVTTGIEESRRASFIKDQGVLGLAGNRLSVASISAAVQKRESMTPVEVPVDEGEDDEEYEEQDEEYDEEEEEQEEEAGIDDGPEKVTSNAATRSIKWIRGALIGSGSFGNVYLGMDSQRGLLMAVKQVELRGSNFSQERKQSMLSALEREIELLKTLQHENIVQYLDSAIDDNNLIIFLEYVPGGSVASLLRNYGAFEESLTANWVRQILTGLEYLHGQTIIHRDIKGANILVDNKGGIKISDFGISKKVEEGFPRANRPSLQGSVYWMAPEVVRQTAYTSKADIWSVGCLIIEMLTGTHPFPELAQMQAIFKLGSGAAKPTIPPDVTPEAVDFLMQTFELDHNARPSAAELMNHAWLRQNA